MSAVFAVVAQERGRCARSGVGSPDSGDVGRSLRAPGVRVGVSRVGGEPDATDCGEHTVGGVRGAGGGAVILDRRVVNCWARVFSSSVFSMSKLCSHASRLTSCSCCS